MRILADSKWLRIMLRKGSPILTTLIVRVFSLRTILEISRSDISQKKLVHIRAEG